MWKDRMIPKSIRNLAKRNQTIVNLYSNLYHRWLFLRSIPIRDFTKIHKLKLFFVVRPSYTGLIYSRLSNLYELASYLEEKKVGGGFVELGVWNGGSAAIMAEVAKHNKARHIYLFDSWEGLPEPRQVDISYVGSPGKKGVCLGSEEKCKELIYKKLKLDEDRIHLINGWFNDTIPISKRDIGEIALLHIDCDWYESVKFRLRELYDNVIKGGFIVIGDYGYWRGCKLAVDEFIQEKNLKIELIKIDYSIDWSGVYFQK